MFSPCFCCLLLASSDSAHMVCLMRWYHTVVFADKIGREAVLIRELDLVLWIIKLALQWRPIMGVQEWKIRENIPVAKVVNAYMFLFPICSKIGNWILFKFWTERIDTRTQEWLIQIINQHCFVSLLLFK